MKDLTNNAKPLTNLNFCTTHTCTTQTSFNEDFINYYNCIHHLITSHHIVHTIITLGKRKNKLSQPVSFGNHLTGNEIQIVYTKIENNYDNLNITKATILPVYFSLTAEINSVILHKNKATAYVKTTIYMGSLNKIHTPMGLYRSQTLNTLKIKDINKYFRPTEMINCA